jgi:hypothetical protein
MADPAEDMNYLEMPDDDFLNLPVPEEDVANEEVPSENEEDVTEPEPEEEQEEGEEGLPADGEPSDKERSDADGEGEPEGGKKPEVGESDKDAASVSEAPKEPDYKSFYEALTGPLKANGKEYKFDKPEEIRRLASMGLNYNHKMVAIKPHLKTLKLLEHNGLLDEKKLSFYIDIEKKNPAAIAKLLKDSGIDPMDLNIEQDGYEAKTYSVDEREIDLDQVLEELRDSTHYPQILETVSKRWDKASQQTIGGNPGILHIINDHMNSGVYDIVSQELDRQRALGGLRGLSDLEAYKQVGDTLHAQGKFNHLFEDKSGTAAPAPKQEVTPPTPNATESTAADKRRAARATKASPTPAKAPDYNPLGLSDDEFERQFDPKLM